MKVRNRTSVDMGPAFQPGRTARACHSGTQPASIRGNRAGTAGRTAASSRTSARVRTTVVDQAKRRLASGFYDLPECLELAVDRMIDTEG